MRYLRLLKLYGLNNKEILMVLKTLCLRQQDFGTFLQILIARLKENEDISTNYFIVKLKDKIIVMYCFEVVVA